MTVDEIRNSQVDLQRECYGHLAVWLQEIAAQLAELNDKLGAIADRIERLPQG